MTGPKIKTASRCGVEKRVIFKRVKAAVEPLYQTVGLDVGRGGLHLTNEEQASQGGPQLGGELWPLVPSNGGGDSNPLDPTVQE